MGGGCHKISRQNDEEPAKTVKNHTKKEGGQFHLAVPNQGENGEKMIKYFTEL